MRISSLKVKQGLYEKTFILHDNINLIFSDINSVGKTTLLRMIAFSLGYMIPSTRGIDFNRYEFFMEIITTSNKMLSLYRLNDFYSITFEDIQENYSLPVDIYEIQKRIFEIENSSVLQNLLGVFYVDQEKGWTLLNRGKCIGNNHFNIENLIQGLSNRSCDELYSRLSNIKREIQKYKHMFNTAQYQKELNDLNENIEYDTNSEELQKTIDILDFERKPLDLEAKRLESVIKKNTSFKKYIESMKLFVKAPDGTNIPVNENTLVNFLDNNEYVITKRTMIYNQIIDIDKKIQKLKELLNKDRTFIAMETLIQSFDSDVSKIRIDVRAVENVIQGLEREKKMIEDEIKNNTRINNSLVDELHTLISSYSKELGVDEMYVRPNKDYIFTSDLKSLSGAILHKIVFAFKLAYIKSVKKYANIILPIILDSPSGREVDKINVEDMMKILERDFSEHQIIIASIYKYDFTNVNLIVLKGQLLGF